MIKILFVCHGNICRSPMAEYILKDMAARQGRLGEFEIDSAAVSREEFLAMAMDLVEMDTLPQAQLTGFADDDSISAWAKPYVASALRSGMVQGTGAEGERACFAPDRGITGTEAAVMLNRLLGISDVADTGSLSQEAAPAWAYQSVVNLTAVGMLDQTGDGQDLSQPLTRAQAAELLLSAMEVLEFRESTW